MTDTSILSKIVWAETGDLQAVEDGGDRLLRAAVASVVRKRGESQFRNRADPPAADQPDAVKAWNAMEGELKALGGSPPATPPDQMVVLWEVGRDGNPVERPTPLPPAAQWVLKDQPQDPQDFVSRSDPKGRRYRIFAKSSPADGASYISGYTGTGLAKASAPPRPWYHNPNWWLGIAAAALFFIAAGNVLWTGRALSQAADLLAGRQPDAFTVFFKGALANPASLPACIEPAPPGVSSSPPAGACELRDAVVQYANAQEDLAAKKAASAADLAGKAKKTAVSAADEAVEAKRFEAQALFESYVHGCFASLQSTPLHRASPDAAEPTAAALQAYSSCLVVWGKAVAFASSNLVFNRAGPISGFLSSGAGWLFGWTAASAGSESIDLGTPLAVMMMGVSLLLVALGRGFADGKNLGAFINAQGRYSLGLAQATFWTILIISGLIAISLFNAGLLAERMRDTIATLFAASGSATFDSDRFSIIPTIPTEIWAVLGITLGSPLLSTLILRLKPKVPEGSPDLDTLANRGVADDQKGVSFKNFSGSAIAERRTNVRASIADWFLGEEGENYDRIDLSRVQMVLITAGMLVVYGHLLFTTLQDISLGAIIASLKDARTMIPNLPPVSSTMAALLAISHSTYLVTKAAPVNRTSGAGSNQDNTRAR